MAKVLLGVTGSVAAVRAPELYASLRADGHHVKVVATHASLYFFDPAELGREGPSRPERDRAVVILDEDEWPGFGEGRRYRRDDPVLHIELRRWADLFLVAPLDANTLAKLANGLCDNCLTCVWRAWDASRPAVVGPAMNTLMWEHPLTRGHLLQLAEAAGADTRQAVDLPLESVVGWLNENCPRLRVVPPQNKRLACGDVGVGALAGVPEIVETVRLMLGEQGV